MDKGQRLNWNELNTRSHTLTTHTPCQANQLGPTLFKSTSPAGLFVEEYQTSCLLSFFPIRGSGLHYCRPAGCRRLTLTDTHWQTDRQRKVQALNYLTVSVEGRYPLRSERCLSACLCLVRPHCLLHSARCLGTISAASHQLVFVFVSPVRVWMILHYPFCCVIVLRPSKRRNDEQQEQWQDVTSAFTIVTES